MLEALLTTALATFLWQALGKNGACWSWQGIEYQFKLINKLTKGENDE